jgi:hypothetical protein
LILMGMMDERNEKMRKEGKQGKWIVVVSISAQ